MVSIELGYSVFLIYTLFIDQILDKTHLIYEINETPVITF